MKKIIFFSILVIIGILFTAQIKRGAISLLILIDSMRPSEKAVMGRFIDGPSVKSVRIPSGGRKLQADLYRPKKTGKHFPLLLVHGVSREGKNDEHLVLLAKNFARAGFVVLVPDFEGMKTLRIRISDAEDILESFSYLKKLNYAGPGGTLMGMDGGVGPMLLAAADSRIRDAVSVVVTFGGYYDLRNVMLFSMTGVYEYGGHRGYTRPQESLRWMVAFRNLEILHSPNDREKLRLIIEKRNRYENAGAASLADSLGQEGRAVYDFLVNTDQEHFAPLYEKLPLPLREQVYQLSPARAVKYVGAYFIIAHGIDDYAIPYTESVRLADAVGNKKRVHLALLPQLMQPEPAGSSEGSLFQRYGVSGWRLYFLIYDLLERGGL